MSALCVLCCRFVHSLPCDAEQIERVFAALHDAPAEGLLFQRILGMPSPSASLHAARSLAAVVQFFQPVALPQFQDDAPIDALKTALADYNERVFEGSIAAKAVLAYIAAAGMFAHSASSALGALSRAVATAMSSCAGFVGVSPQSTMFIATLAALDCVSSPTLSSIVFPAGIPHGLPTWLLVLSASAKPFAASASSFSADSQSLDLLDAPACASEFNSLLFNGDLASRFIGAPMQRPVGALQCLKAVAPSWDSATPEAAVRSRSC